jgi:uncharacterized membrane protein YvbJ
MSISQNTCPSCKQANEADMAFCIHCGAKLEADNAQANKNTMAGDAFTCTSCGKTDPLNKHFCIHCGAKTVHTSYVDKSNLGQNIGTNKSKDVFKVNIFQSIFSNLFIAVLLGLIIGILSAIKFAPDTCKILLQNICKNKDIVIYTKQTSANILLSDEQKQNFIVGETSNSGEIAISNLKSGKYNITLLGNTDNTANQQIELTDLNRPYIIGYPKRLQ